MRLELPNPVEAIKFELDQRGLTLNDLEDVIGRYEAVRTSRLSSATRMVRLSIKRVGSAFEVRFSRLAIDTTVGRFRVNVLPRLRPSLCTTIATP